MRRRDSIKVQNNLLQQRLDEKKNRLSENATCKTLESLEAKLRHYEQNIFSLKSFIDNKNREVNYTSLKEHCLRIVDETNQNLIESYNGQVTASY